MRRTIIRRIPLKNIVYFTVGYARFINTLSLITKKEMGSTSMIVIIIIAINAIASFKGFNDRVFLQKYMFTIAGIRNGEHIRMVTSGFLHADIPHLAFNMLTLYFFAPIVISNLGTQKFVGIYIASLVVGSMFALFFNKNNYHYSALGASGAVSGVIFSAILFEPTMKMFLMFIPIPIPAFIFGIGYLLYSIFGMKNKIGNIGHDAHFGGAVGGYFVTLFLAPWLFETQLWIVVILAIPILLLFILQKMGKL